MPEAVLDGLAADGQLFLITPTGSDTGAHGITVIVRSSNCALSQGGWKVFESSIGFHFPPKISILNH
jgi:hypothetical protein